MHNSPSPHTPDPAEEAGGDVPRVLMLGLGWFPPSIGGLDRYYRGLFEALPEAVSVVIGPALQAPSSVHPVARERSPMIRRLLAYRAAAIRLAPQIELLDAHFALYALAPLRSRALRSKPAVFHFHGPWAEENVAAGDASEAKRRVRRTLERRTLKRAEAIVVLSGAFRALLIERYQLSPWRIHVIAPGVELDRFTPGDRSATRERLGIEPSAFVAVCARRQVPRMGIETLLDAWGTLQDELPRDSTLLLIGDGTSHEQIVRRCAEPSLAGRVRCLGRVSDAELIEAYRAADVAVVPSLAFEGFGLVVLEAASCGTPSIVSDVGGLPEASAGLDRSLVQPPGDVNALRTRLLGASRGRLPSREASRRHAERFDWGTAAETHRRLYRRLARGAADERTRVVYLDHVARLSGGEIALLRLLPHLQRTNAHVILAEDGPLAKRLIETGMSVEVLAIAPSARDVRKDSLGGIAGLPRATLHTVAYVIRLAVRLRRLRPDLVHSNSLKSGFYGAAAAKLAGVPMLWHLRDRIAEDYLPGPAVRLTRLLIARLADGVVANSSATLETAPRSSRNRVHIVIPDSVEPPELARAKDSAEVTFGMLGRIAPWKGQDLFLRAFAAAFPDGPERAVIVGIPMFGEESFEQELRRLVEELGLTERVELRGFREDIWPELASFQVLVHASIIPEPFGQVVLEGMAAGLAVIAADEGGPASIIRDGETGRLFRSRDAGALSTAMLAMRDSPAERERLGGAARLAVADYHPTALAERLEQAYEQLTGASRRSPN